MAKPTVTVCSNASISLCLEMTCKFSMFPVIAPVSRLHAVKFTFCAAVKWVLPRTVMSWLTICFCFEQAFAAVTFTVHGDWIPNPTDHSLEEYELFNSAPSKLTFSASISIFPTSIPIAFFTSKFFAETDKLPPTFMVRPAKRCCIIRSDFCPNDRPFSTENEKPLDWTSRDCESILSLHETVPAAWSIRLSLTEKSVPIMVTWESLDKTVSDPPAFNCEQCCSSCLCLVLFVLNQLLLTCSSSRTVTLSWITTSSFAEIAMFLAAWISVAVALIFPSSDLIDTLPDEEEILDFETVEYDVTSFEELKKPLSDEDVLCLVSLTSIITSFFASATAPFSPETELAAIETDPLLDTRAATPPAPRLDESKLTFPSTDFNRTEFWDVTDEFLTLSVWFDAIDAPLSNLRLELSILTDFALRLSPYPW